MGGWSQGLIIHVNRFYLDYTERFYGKDVQLSSTIDPWFLSEYWKSITEKVVAKMLPK